MKLPITFLSILFLFTNSHFFAQGAMYDELNHYGQFFYDVDADDSSVTAAGDNLIIHSTDAGISWKEIYLPSNGAQIKHVSKVSTDHFVAAGKFIYVTTNNGDDWIIQEDMTGVESMENFGNTIIITRDVPDQRFMRSDDGGISWVNLSTSNVDDPRTLDYVDTDDAYFSDPDGNIYYSFNGGLSWTIINDSFFSEPIESLRFITKDHGYAQIGDLVWETLDAGATWNQILDSFIVRGGVYPLPSGLYTQSSSNFAVSNGTGGLSYILQDDDIDEVFSFDIAEGDGKLYLSGSGMILINDLNVTLEEWTDLTPGPNDGFNFMTIRDNKFVATGGRRIQISNDNGVSFTNEDTGFSQIKDLAIGPDGTLYLTQSGLQKSVNDGKDWEFVIPSTSLVHVFDDGRILVAGNGKISQSTDNGISFEQLAEFSVGLHYDLYFYDNNLGWFLNSSGDSYRTVDGGATWEVINFPFGSSPSRMHFIDNQNGFAIKRFTDKFWKTTDGGLTWEEIEFDSGDGDFTDVYFEDSMNGYVVGRFDINTEGVIYKTEDGGDTWTIFQKGINLFYGITNDPATGKTWACGERAQLYSYKACDNLIPTLSYSNNRITCNENSSLYKWYLNDELLIETEDPFLDVIQEGIYNVRILGSENCVSDLSEDIDAIVISSI